MKAPALGFGWVCGLPFALCLLHYGAAASAQPRLIDRVLARVGTAAVTMSDVRAAVGLGLVDVEPGGDGEARALQRTIDRQLLLAEVARFPPPEPTADEVAREVSAMTARAGPGLESLLESTGLDEARLQELARETLRIRQYIAQRFGTTAQVTDEEVRRYFDEHPGEFTRDGVLVPFEDAEPAARQRASAERLGVTIDRWIGDLRTRAEVVIVGSRQ
jgi:hypothetical protein